MRTTEAVVNQTLSGRIWSEPNPGGGTIFRLALAAALDSASDISGGCILVDVQMPEMEGIELLLRLTDGGLRVPVIVMTGHGDVQTAVCAMKAGAIDFIEEPFHDDSIIAAVAGAFATVGRMALAREAAEAAERIAALSRREGEVLNALVAGCSNKAIAHDLGISVRTVEVHRARMFERLGARCFADAIRLAVIAAWGSAARRTHGPDRSSSNRHAR